jgi:hypothetical protein
MEALPHEPEPTARGSLAGLEISWSRGHSPLYLRSRGHTGCMAFERAGAVQANASMLPGECHLLKNSPVPSSTAHQFEGAVHHAIFGC